MQAGMAGLYQLLACMQGCYTVLLLCHINALNVQSFNHHACHMLLIAIVAVGGCRLQLCAVSAGQLPANGGVQGIVDCARLV